jgi:hypothetical protein
MALPSAQRERVYALLVERDGETCQFCGLTAGIPDELQIDHKTPRSRGGTDDLENLHLLCSFCNNSKASQTLSEAEQPIRLASGTSRKGYTMAWNSVLFNAELSAQARLLYVQMQHYGFLAEHGVAVPDQKGIGANLRIGDRQLRDYLRELEEAKLVKTERRGRGLTNRYVVYDPPAGMARVDRQDTSGLERQSGSGQTGTTVPLHVREDRKTKSSGAKAPSDAAEFVPNDDAENERTMAWVHIHGALVEEVYGAGTDYQRLTRQEKRRVALAANDLERVKATEQDVRDRAGVYRRHPTYASCALTAQALVHHWNELAPRVVPPASAPCPECGVGGGHHLADCAKVQAA